MSGMQEKDVSILYGRVCEESAFKIQISLFHIQIF